MCWRKSWGKGAFREVQSIDWFRLRSGNDVIAADLREVQLVDVVTASLGLHSLWNAVPCELHFVVEHPARTIAGIRKCIRYLARIECRGIETEQVALVPRWRFSG